MVSESRISGAARRFAAVLLAPLLLAAVPSGVSAQHILSLNDALSIAMENSPDIRHTKFRLDASEARLRAEEASLKTQFGLTLGPISYQNTNRFDEFFSTWYTYESKDIAGQISIRQPIKWTDGVLSLNDRLSWHDTYSEVNDESTQNYRNALYLQFDQPLFTYNRMKMDLSELELDYESSELSFVITKLNIERRVMREFYYLYADKMRLEINRDAMESDRENHRIMKNKYDAGIGKLDDLTQAETDMLSSESNYNNTTVSLANAFDRFKYLIGLPLDDNIDIDTDIGFNPVGIDMEFAVRHGLETRMELRQQEITIANAYNAVVRAGTVNEFRGDLHLSWGSSGTNPDFNNIYEKRTDEQLVSISFDIPIWDWGQKKNTILASEISLESQKLTLEEDRYEITMDIRESCRALDNLVRQIELASRRVESAEKTYDINLEKYQNGDLTSQLLGDYRQSLSNARLSEINDLINYRLQLLDLKIQSLWDFENDRPVITISTSGIEEGESSAAGLEQDRMQNGAAPAEYESDGMEKAIVAGPVPVGKPSTAAPASEVSYYTVHVASFTEIGRAGSESDYLEKNGFAATILATEVNGQTWYRVYVGEYRTPEEAASTKQRLLDLSQIGYAKVVPLNYSKN